MTLLEEVDDMLRRTGMSPTRLGLDLFNDSSLVGKLRRGETGLGPTRQARLREWLDSQIVQSVSAPTAMPVAVSFGGHDWTRSAKIASTRLLDALRRHHPERCAA